MTENKFRWEHYLSGLKHCLAGGFDVAPGYDFYEYDNDMRLIQEWCLENKCGRRVGFDTFKFKSKREMTMFLLRWS